MKERTIDEWLKIVPAEWLNLSEWFSPINSHPDKEEIIECHRLKINNSEKFGFYFTEDFVKSCMDKYAESIKEQLVERVSGLELVARPPIRDVTAKDAIEIICDIIRNFKAE